MKELSLVVMLVTPKTATLNTLTYRYAERGVHQLSDAIILVIIVFILAAHGFTNWLGRKDGGRRMEV
jgi:iron(III) transport system permease protein